MARTSTRGRSSSRRPTASPAAVAAPATRIPVPHSSHVRDAVLLGCTGFAAAGVGSLAGKVALGVCAAVACWVLAVLVGVHGHRRSQRVALEILTLEAVAPVLGVRELDRRIMRTSRWTRAWPGHPGIIRLHYSPSAPDSDPVWLSEVLVTVSSRLQAEYRISGHDRRRCRLTLSLVPADPNPAPAPPRAQVRAEKAVAELIGPTTQVTAVELDGDQLQAITVSHQAGAKLAASGYRSRIERTISTMMPGRWRALWDLEADTVRFERRPQLPSSVWLPAAAPPDTEDLLRNYRDVKIPCAVDEDGREVIWRPAVVPQVMLTGGTGSGKTSMAHALLGQITRYGWPVWVLDAKRVEFLDFRQWPNVQIVAGTITAQVALIRRAWELMEHRYALIEHGHARVSDFEPLVVFLDEFAEFRSNLLEWYAAVKVKGDPTKPPTLAEVASLARKARTARIHLVLSTQRPDAEFLGGEMRDNFGFRISMGRLSPDGARMMWENPSVGITLPRGCVGRATATHEDGRPVEAQCYRFPDMDAPAHTEQWELLQQLRPASQRWPRLVIVPPDPDPETGAPPTFREVAGAQWALATDRPDLDPLADGGGEDRSSGRELSSTLAALGIAGSTAGVPGVGLPADALPVAVAEAIAADGGRDDGVALGEGLDRDYASATAYPVSGVRLGDLIETDPGSGIWVVVDEDPVADPSDPGLLVLSWRDDDDAGGTLVLSVDDWLDVRRPLQGEDL